jgi:hypothetical protein
MTAQAQRPMDKSKTFRQDEYEMACSARPDDSGRFIPGLVITKQVWPTRPRKIDVPRGNHASEDDAIEAAHVHGLEWIRNYG